MAVFRRSNSFSHCEAYALVSAPTLQPVHTMTKTICLSFNYTSVALLLSYHVHCHKWASIACVGSLFGAQSREVQYSTPILFQHYILLSTGKLLSIWHTVPTW